MSYPYPQGGYPPSNTGYPPISYHIPQASQVQPFPQSRSYQAPPSSTNHPVVEIPPQPPQFSQNYRQYDPQPIQYTSRPQQQAPPPMSVPQKRPQLQSHISPNMNLKSVATPNQPPPLKEPPPANPHLLLLTLAEDYISAAHGIGSLAALAQRPAELGQYYKLMAMGLGCMESLLKDRRLHPRTEADLTLRYASLLFEETENTIETETILSKGITLCERNRFFDLKYGMQHLLARILFKSNPRAALKSVDSLIQTVETYQHVAWVYAFRFLRVSFSLQVSSHPEIVSALHNLRSICALAEHHGDVAVFVTAFTLEAMIHLRASSPDSMEQAQRAIAAARRHQMNISVKELAPVVALLDMLDLICSLHEYNPEHSAKKLETLQKIMDAAALKSNSKDDGVFTVVLEHSSGGQLTSSTGGIFRRNAQGRDQLSFTWLVRRDLYTLAYYLSGVTAHIQKNDDKSAKYFKEGLRMLKESFILRERQASSVVNDSMYTAAARIQWENQLELHIRLHLAFHYCLHGDWEAARKGFAELKQKSCFPASQTSPVLAAHIAYLGAVIDQARGSLDAALSVFQSPALSLTDNTPHISDALNDLRLLAALNTLLILRQPNHPQRHIAPALLSRLELRCPKHPNKSIFTAFNLVKAIYHPGNSVVKTKQCINHAIQTARNIGNKQLVAISMTFMVSMFFTNIIGEQAEKSANTARALSQRWGDRLWMCVCDGMAANTLEKHGKNGEAAQARAKAQAALEILPAQLREVCRIHGQGSSS